MKYNYGWLFALRFYGPLNSYGHVEPISHPLTLLLAGLDIQSDEPVFSEHMSAVVIENYHYVITDRVHNVSVISSRLQRVGTLEKKDMIDEIKYSPPVPYFLQPADYPCEIYAFA